jgi:hypothetical protein
MTPIDFEVTGLALKKAFLLKCLGMLWSTVFIFGIEIVMTN